MCIAVYKPENIELTETTLKNCWDNNSDGAGFMYAEDGKLTIVKGLMTYKDFLEAYTPHKLKQCVLHFRIATHGGVDALNTHPFAIDENLGMVHNGILGKVKCDLDEKMSDTWHFIEKFMKPFRKRYAPFWQYQHYKELIENYIVGSKFILMNNRGEVQIYNEGSGNWNSECWFSNMTWSYEKKVYSYQTKTETRFDRRKTIEKRPSLTTLKVGDKAIIVHPGAETSGMFDNGKGKWEKKPLPEGTLVTIDYFSQTNTGFVGVRVFGNSAETAYLPLWKLDTLAEVPVWNIGDDEWCPGTLVTFTKDHNHFRVGTSKSIVRATTSFVIIEDKEKQKTYSIPKEKLMPSNLMLLN